MVGCRTCYSRASPYVAPAMLQQPDGSAKVSMTLPDFPIHANAVLLIYHSDGQTHGLERGRIGIDAHHQLIARMKEPRGRRDHNLDERWPKIAMDREESRYSVGNRRRK